MGMFVNPRILNQSKYTMNNRQSIIVFSILFSFPARTRLAKQRGSEAHTTIRTGSLYLSASGGRDVHLIV